MYKEKIHAYKVFAEDLSKAKLKNVMLIYGEEEYLIKWAIDSVINKYVSSATKQMNISFFDETEMSSTDLVSAVCEACETLPLFSDKRVIVVKEMKALSSDSSQAIKDADLHLLCSSIEKLQDEAILIFTARNVDKGKKLPKEITKAGKEYNFDRLDRKDLASFANKRFKQAKKTISNANMHLLLDETGYFNRESDYDLYTFMNDISKLIAASGDVIEEKAIRELVIRDEDTFVFNLLDSIAAGRKDRALAQLHNILGDGGDEFQLIGSIVSQFELMYCTKQMLDEGMQVREIASKLKANEYRIKNITKYTQGFSAEKLSKVLSSAYELSSQITTGLLKSSMALELFIAGI